MVCLQNKVQAIVFFKTRALVQRILHSHFLHVAFQLTAKHKLMYQHRLSIVLSVCPTRMEEDVLLHTGEQE